jgi:P27 family predicted phage terminase small subunit
MPKGRRPAPQELKKKRGTARKDRAPENPVTVTKAKPTNTAPSFLKAKGKMMYERSVGHLHSMGLLSTVDDTSLELLAMAYQEWYSAELKLMKEGRIYETFAANGAKVLKPHPAAAQSSDAWRRIRMMLIEFGLTPASRSKLERPEGRTLDIDDIIEM